MKLLKRSFIFTILCTVFSCHAGGGKSFGLFAGGALTGAFITSAIKDSKPRETVVVQQQPAQVVYVPQPIADSASPRSTRKLEDVINNQQEEIEELKREIRTLVKKAEKDVATQTQSEPFLDQ